MNEKNLVIGVLFLIWGGVSLLRPEIIIKFRQLIAKKIFGVKYETSARTLVVQRIMGLLFIAVALIIMEIV